MFSQGRTLTAPQWTLVEMNGSRVGRSSAFIRFGPQKGRFGGNTGCNIMSGNAMFRGSRVRFSDVITTKRACVQGKPSLIDAQVSRIFGKTLRYSLKKGMLIITGGDGLSLKFAASTMPQGSGPAASSLESRKWMLESVARKPVGKEGKEAFIVFDPVKGSAGGNTSCNVFGGSYTAKGAKLKITEIISTMRACIEDNRMEVERGFLDGLRDADRYDIKRDKLFIYRGSRELLAFYGTDK
jgi:heat shock protein HslJ